MSLTENLKLSSNHALCKAIQPQRYDTNPTVVREKSPCGKLVVNKCIYHTEDNLRNVVGILKISSYIFDFLEIDLCGTQSRAITKTPRLSNMTSLV